MLRCLVLFLAILASAAIEMRGTAAASLSRQEQSYVNAALPLTQDMSDSLQAFTTLMGDPSIGSTSWGRDAAVEFSTWKRVYREALLLAPPPSMASIHRSWVAGLKIFSEEGPKLSAAIRDMDPAAMEAATGRVLEAHGYLSSATDQLTAFSSSRQTTSAAGPDYTALARPSANASSGGLPWFGWGGLFVGLAVLWGLGRSAAKGKQPTIGPQVIQPTQPTPPAARPLAADTGAPARADDWPTWKGAQTP